MEHMKQANKNKIETIIRHLEKRGISGTYADTAEAAMKQAVTFAKKGMKVSCGGSMTLTQIGLRDALASMDIEYIDPNQYKDEEKKYEERVKALGADVYYMSSNAITMDGILVNIDATGNRVAALCYGPKKVVLIVGANKIVASEDGAVAKIKTDTCPANCLRLGRTTPCAVTGKCGNCLNPEQTICSMTVTTRMCNSGRLHVILVNDNLGY